MTTNNNYILDQLAARVEHELENDHDLIMQRVIRQEIAEAIEDTFGIRADVKIVLTTKLLGFRFVEAMFDLGATSVTVEARRFRNSETVVKKVSVDGTKVRNARELSEAIDSRHHFHDVNFR